MKTNKLSALCAGLLIALSTQAQAENPLDKINVGVRGDMDININEDGEESIRSKDLILDVTTQMGPVMIEMGLDVSQAVGNYLRQNGENVNVDIDGEKLLDTLTASVNLADGAVQIKMGKQTIELIQNSYAGSQSQDPLYDTKRLQQVIAGVISAHPAFLSAVADSIDVWIADSTEFDNDLGDGDPSYGIKVAKQLSDRFRVSASYSSLSSGMEENDGSTDVISASIEAALNDRFSAYVTVIDVNPDDLVTDQADETYIQMGAKTKRVLGGTAGLDYTRAWDEESDNIQFSLEYQLTKNLKAKPYIGVTMYKDDADKDKSYEGGAEFLFMFN